MWSLAIEEKDVDSRDVGVGCKSRQRLGKEVLPSVDEGFSALDPYLKFLNVTYGTFSKFQGSGPSSNGTEDGLYKGIHRGCRRQERIDMDEEALERRSHGVKPYNLHILTETGEIDGSCHAKSAWDAAVRVAVPRTLDMSIIVFEHQDSTAVLRLKTELDKEFNYVPKPLSNGKFKSAISRYMKTTRNTLKGKWLKGKVDCPYNIQPDQWQRMMEHWDQEEQKLKAQKMALARSKVSQVSSSGRKGKAPEKRAVSPSLQ